MGALGYGGCGVTEVQAELFDEIDFCYLWPPLTNEEEAELEQWWRDQIANNRSSGS